MWTFGQRVYIITETMSRSLCDCKGLPVGGPKWFLQEDEIDWLVNDQDRIQHGGSDPFLVQAIQLGRRLHQATIPALFRYVEWSQAIHQLNRSPKFALDALLPTIKCDSNDTRQKFMGQLLVQLQNDRDFSAAFGPAQLLQLLKAIYPVECSRSKVDLECVWHIVTDFCSYRSVEFASLLWDDIYRHVLETSYREDEGNAYFLVKLATTLVLQSAQHGEELLHRYVRHSVLCLLGFCSLPNQRHGAWRGRSCSCVLFVAPCIAPEGNPGFLMHAVIFC